MSDIVLMPQLGETVAEGKILAWFKSVGDEIKASPPYRSSQPAVQKVREAAARRNAADLKQMDLPST